eukprot:EG_transcript_10259
MQLEEEREKACLLHERLRRAEQENRCVAEVWRERLEALRDQLQAEQRVLVAASLPEGGKVSQPGPKKPAEREKQRPKPKLKQKAASWDTESDVPSGKAAAKAQGSDWDSDTEAPVRKPAATVAGANWDSDSAEEGPQPAAPGKRPTAAAGGWDSDSEPEAAPRKPAKPAPKKAASGWDSDSEDDTPAEPKPKPKPKSAGWDSDSQEEQASPSKRAKGLAKQLHAEQGDPQSPTNATVTLDLLARTLHALEVLDMPAPELPTPPGAEEALQLRAQLNAAQATIRRLENEMEAQRRVSLTPLDESAAAVTQPGRLAPGAAVSDSSDAPDLPRLQQRLREEEAKVAALRQRLQEAEAQCEALRGQPEATRGGPGQPLTGAGPPSADPRRLTARLTAAVVATVLR